MAIYTCPMHPAVQAKQTGKCPECRMQLVKLTQLGKTSAVLAAQPGILRVVQTYQPLIIVFAVITIISLIMSTRSITEHNGIHAFMMTFMSGFFIAFGSLKLLDLSGFAMSFMSYDPIAKYSRQYAYAYPFIELTLGFMYAANVLVAASNIVTLCLTALGIAGVAIKLCKHEAVQCACLGTFLKIPLTKVTLAENLAMFIMAAFMLQGFGFDHSGAARLRPAGSLTSQQSTTTTPDMHMDMNQL